MHLPLFRRAGSAWAPSLAALALVALAATALPSGPPPSGMTCQTAGGSAATETIALGAPALSAALPVPPAPADRVGPRSSADEERPARLALAPGGRDLILAGDLTEGVAARVAATLAAHPRVTRLHLDSDGGLVDEATAIGRLVAARGLSTYVPDACASACTLIFAQGRKRYLGPEGRLGFHAPYDVEEDGRVQPVDPAPERAAYRAAGLPAAFVARALKVPPAEIWIPTTAELRAAHIVTEVVARDRFPTAPTALAEARPVRVAEACDGDCPPVRLMGR